jgi:hypothetical protein
MIAIWSSSTIQGKVPTPLLVKEKDYVEIGTYFSLSKSQVIRIPNNLK